MWSEEFKELVDYLNNPFQLRRSGMSIENDWKAWSGVPEERHIISKKYAAPPELCSLWRYDFYKYVAPPGLSNGQS